MSDGNRSKRAKQKPPVETELIDQEKARDELTRMWQREPTPQPAKPVRTTRQWEIFDELPEQRQRAPIAPVASQSSEPSQPAAPTRIKPPRPASAMLDEPTAARPSPIAESRATLHSAESRYGTAWSALPPPPGYGQLRSKPWLMVVIALLSMTVIYWYLQPQRSTVNTHSPAPNGASKAAAPALPVPSGEHSIVRAPTISASKIDQILASFNSPAVGSGQDWVTLGEKYRIDPAYGIAFFINESTAGTASGWAGWKENGGTTHNIGNIICAGYATCYGGFRDYPGWKEGIEDWYKLLSVEYINGRGVQTVEQILPVYCPVADGCHTDHYIETVNKMVAEWRSQ